ncbi:MAG TPA: prepilin-type N-terminal cleavage/methylation domain-containing protein [Acidimicrobiales bacterium]|nr:prepilin-type N-terminal cleavage/methylation domain-containing protein [Acidimicrobiales bacterium]
MIQRYYEKLWDIRRRRAAGEEVGFTLIELLIVIVVLGILAATVIFALSGVTSSSAVAACNSDAKSVEVAVQAYRAYPGNNNAWPANQAALTGSANGGPYLQSWPSNTGHYVISIDGSGNVYVNPPGGTAQTAATNYTAATNPCSSVS